MNSTTSTSSRGRNVAVHVVAAVFCLIALAAGILAGTAANRTPAGAATSTAAETAQQTDCGLLCTGSGSGGAGTLGTPTLGGGTVGSGGINVAP